MIQNKLFHFKIYQFRIKPKSFQVSQKYILQLSQAHFQNNPQKNSTWSSFVYFSTEKIKHEVGLYCYFMSSERTLTCLQIINFTKPIFVPKMKIIFLYTNIMLLKLFCSKGSTHSQNQNFWKFSEFQYVSKINLSCKQQQQIYV